MEEIRKIYMHLKGKKPARSWEIINESINKEPFDIKVKALHDWKKSTVHASFQHLQQSMKEEDIDLHILCQISREFQKEFDQSKEKLLIRPSSTITKLLPDHIGIQTFQLGIELGLSVVKMQHIAMNHVTNLRGQTEEVLNTWRTLPEATYEVLVNALHRLDLSSVLSYITYEEALEEILKVGLERKVEVGLEEQIEVELEDLVEVELEEQIEIGLGEQVKERIIQDIEISQILDYMMSHLVISSDDRRRIEQHAGQDDQNKALLEVVKKRGESTYTVFVDALRISGYTDLADELKRDSHEEGSNEALEPPPNEGLSEWNVPVYKVRLQKNYSNIVHCINHENIVDHLISCDILTIADSQMINACPAQIQKNRKLMDILLHGSEKGFIEFLKSIREDSVTTELAEEIESTLVTSRDISIMQGCYK
ncbi:unnamed protein product [Mytilus edulis]|uniref:Death domain-containing protein n=1 Tax=Mytilus edulis TaxID=6550 RepID=A0A8S3V352_MYTED|nr:unnamed protein product [Mytilus edulis]